MTGQWRAVFGNSCTLCINNYDFGTNNKNLYDIMSFSENPNERLTLCR